MRYTLPPQFRGLELVAALIESAAVSVSRDLRERLGSVRPRRGATLRPGVDTPHWLALVREVRPFLSKRGSRALLARELGVHRSQVSRYFFSCTAMPDAERTLLLLGWLVRQRRIK